jgi:hypothetical protein
MIPEYDAGFWRINLCHIRSRQILQDARLIRLVLNWDDFAVFISLIFYIRLGSRIKWILVHCAPKDSRVLLYLMNSPSMPVRKSYKIDRGSLLSRSIVPTHVIPQPTTSELAKCLTR